MPHECDIFPTFAVPVTRAAFPASFGTWEKFHVTPWNLGRHTSMDEIPAHEKHLVRLELVQKTTFIGVAVGIGE